MDQEQQPIEPEIVNELKKESKINQKENTTKKVFAWIIMLVAIIYGISPIDIVPDIPFVGLIDDFVIGTAAFTNLIQQQFFQTNNTLNKIFNIVKWILISFILITILITVLIITLIVK